MTMTSTTTATAKATTTQAEDVARCLLCFWLLSLLWLSLLTLLLLLLAASQGTCCAHTKTHSWTKVARFALSSIERPASSFEPRIVERNACRAESTIRHQCKNSTKAMMKKSETIYFWGVVHTHIQVHAERCKATHTAAEATAAASTGTRRQPDRQNAH